MLFADAGTGAFVLREGTLTCVFPAPCFAVAAAGARAACFGETEAAILENGAARSFVPPPHVTRAIFLQGALCVLSQEGDGVYLLDEETGAPACFAPAGCFPRDLAASPCGRFLATAGGAGGEVALLEASSLSKERVYRLPGVAVGVSFLKGGLYALCRTENADAAALYALKGNGVRLLRVLHGVPCALCPFGKRLLLGLSGRAVEADSLGTPRRAWRCGLPVRLIPTKDGALLCDAQEERVVLLPKIGKSLVLAHLNDPTDAID